VLEKQVGRIDFVTQFNQERIMFELLLLLVMLLVSVFIGFIGGVAFGIRRQRKEIENWRDNFPHSNFI